jgi:hypothetical protein
MSENNYQYEFINLQNVNKNKIYPYFLINLINSKNKLFECSLPSDFSTIKSLLYDGKAKLNKGVLLYKNKGMYCIVYDNKNNYMAFLKMINVNG